MKIIELEQPIIGDIIEFVTDPDTVVEGLIVAETADGYIYEFSKSGLKELTEACTYGKYFCSTDKKWKCRQSPKKTRNVSEDQDGDEEGEVQGTGQLIPFPAGTTLVDVSDIYDWYKLGMVISDLDDADANTFGQGAPHTVIAFGSEEEENKIRPELKRLGLRLHDIDNPEDVKKAYIAKDVIAKMEAANPAQQAAIAIAKKKDKELDEAHPNSKIYDKCWDGYRKVPGKKRGEKGSCEKVDEAEYQGRTVPLGKPMKGDVKKSKVYVRNDKGNVVKVNFGDPNMRIKKTSPKHRKSFRARHNCDNPGPRWKARYWSCRAW